MHHARPTFLLVALALIATGCTSTLRTSDSYKDERGKIEEIAVMPPDVGFQLRTATVSEPSPDTQAEVNAVVLEALENVLADSRFGVAPLGITDSLLATDLDLALGLTRARESFRIAADSLYLTKHKVITFTVDPEVGQFADRADADYLLFARGESFGSSTGASVRDAAVAVASALLFGGAGLSQQQGIGLELALVNANTAEVVWYNRSKPTQTSYDPLSVKSVERLCAKLLAPLIGPS